MSNFSAFQSRKQLSRAERESELQRYVIITTAVVAALVVLILGFAAVDLLMLQPARPVAKVGDQTITLREFQTAVRFQRYQLISQYSQIAYQASFFNDPQFAQYFEQQASQVASQLSDSNSLGQATLDRLIEDYLIRQEAQRRGITVSAAEVDDRLRQFFGYYPNGTPTPTTTPLPVPTDAAPTQSATRSAQLTAAPTLTPTATLTATSTPIPTMTPATSPTPAPTATPYTEAGYNTQVTSYTTELRQQADISPDDLRHFFESQIYREKLQAAMNDGAAKTELQVEARHILVADLQIALGLIAQLKNGADWEVLAAQYSTDTSNNEQGGYLGWFGKGAMVAEFETAAFSQTVMLIPDLPVQTQFGYHILQVLNREERPLSGTALETAQAQVFQDWLDAQRVAMTANGTPLVTTFDDVWRLAVPDKPDLAQFQQ